MNETVTGIPTVSASAMATRPRHARNLPSTRWSVLTGMVKRNSRVSMRRSSLHIFMVRAALRKMSRIGIHSNNGLESTMLRAKNCSTQKKMNRHTAEKVPRKMNATGDEK